MVNNPPATQGIQNQNPDLPISADSLNYHFDLLTDFVLDYLLLLTAVSTLAMGIVEAYKGLTDARARFHRRMLDTWIRTYSDPTEKLYSELQMPAPRAEGMWNTIKDGFSSLWMDFRFPYANAVLSLEPPQFVGKLQQAMEAALQDPQRHREVIGMLVNAGGTPVRKAVTTWKKQLKFQSEGSADYDAQLAERSYAQIHGTMTYLLDVLMVTCQFTWGRGARLMATVVGAEIMFPLLYMSNQSAEQPLPIWALIPLSLAGGALAPVSKNLVSAIRQARK